MRSFVYASLKRLTQASNPESGAINYTNDADGNLLIRTDAREVRASYTYDALNRVTRKSYSDGTPTVTYSYDRCRTSKTALLARGTGNGYVNLGQDNAINRVPESALRRPKSQLHL